MTLWTKATASTIFVLKSVKLVVSVLQDLPVTLSPIFVFPRTNVTLGRWNQNAMCTKYGMNVEANVLNGIAATLIKDTVRTRSALKFVKPAVNVKKVTQGHTKVTVCQKGSVLSLMALFGILFL